MKAWITRDKGGEVYIWSKKPIKNKECGVWEQQRCGAFFVSNFVEMWFGICAEDVNPQWSDEEPIEIELKIERTNYDN